MSSRSRKARAKLAPPASTADPAAVDSFEPDYGTRCEVCDESPCVTGVKAGRVVYQSGLCGPCTFGTAEAIDPANW
ncbi:hypothetical protein [Paraburkholderia sp. BL10I2N1]|uniref:hypothetical protein n=1 Tax=Paraburkholderia sp. BL10I2N1 TaxID=1938796 RepID=UPI0010E7901C|nr:hypothetical protein [Paraburkholderia sp. BL10I2N1]TDN70646.1 hypothetical protein B0G77_4131 [Paraburkholderia sp. BL10I2N1]